ncbi:MAG: pyruvate, water dikinase [Proteobacteria bacterium]|nr:pyruvate, water dikinase [Pseudomonadota bacterium]
MNPLNWFAESFGFWRKHSPEELERLRAEFLANVAMFKQLIAANRKALDSMAKIDDALEGDKPLGINYVRSCYSTVRDNAYEMVRLLNAIKPKKYEALFDKFTDIADGMKPFLLPDLEAGGGPLVMSLKGNDRSVSEQVGEKMANLAELSTHLGLKIPAGFVVTAKAYWEFLRHNRLQEQIEEILSTIEPAQIGKGIESQILDIRNHILEASLPEALSETIFAEYKNLEEEFGDGVSIAVRSSAQGEDLPGASCAGMYKTVLGVTGENLLDAYKEVIASKYSTNSISYRMSHGIRDDEVAICVGFMPLVNAVCGGVVYTRNPLDTQDEIVSVHSVFGLPGLVVEGAAHSDIILLSRGEPLKIVDHDIAEKQIIAVPTGKAGVSRVSLLMERTKEPSINDQQALELARQALLIERHFGTAQDIEWAVDDSEDIVLLQSRPLLQHKRDKTENALENSDEELSNVLASGEVTASSGVSSGPVFIIRQEADLAAFPRGAVLVVRQPLPDWISAVRKASAVIAEQGSVAGHLASVARELRVPALFRVEQATKLFENGVIVTVHANRKKVCEGRHESLASLPPEPARVLEGTPVYNSLKGAARLTIPLSLLNPDDKKTFRPEQCNSLHDITRFCHEKALREMFRFGAEHRFPERAARQLYLGGPSQFWVIDFADGFKTQTRSSKYIRLDEIESMPMLAIWDGMMKIPWKVPPVNAKGFLEVMMGSTMDPGLNPSMPSPYAQRNYFMISRDYCSCQTRFGYHFSTVEALVGENRQENYISFRFRGGAAGRRRRVNRVRLIASILEDQDVHVRVESDTVHAHLEKFDAPTLLWRLHVFGYLMFHTRQLDMVLTDNNAIAHHKRKIEADLVILKEKCTVPHTSPSSVVR